MGFSCLGLWHWNYIIINRSGVYIGALVKTSEMPVCCLCHRVCSARGHAYPHRRVSLAPTGSSHRFTQVYCPESGLSFPLPWVWARDFHFTRTACNIKHPFRAGAHMGMQAVTSAIRLSEINCGLDHLRASSAVLEVAS